MKKITVAVIGCGRIANNAHFPALEKIAEVRIKYACDILPWKAEKAKADFPKIEEVIADYRIALDDPEIDAVYVLTPNDMHYTVTMDALRAGKHVFCEKPVAMTGKLAEEMEACAAETGKRLMIGVCNRYHRSVEMLKDWLEAGKFGKLYHVYCSFRSFRSIPGLGGAFTDKAKSGGGVLIDWGVHFFDLILYILGMPKIETVTCDTYSEMAKDMKSYRYKSMWAEDTADIEHGTNDVDDFVTGYIRTERASISFNGAWAQNIGDEEMFIDFLGDKGGARLTYGGKFTYWNGETLESVTPEYDIPPMHTEEDKAFISSLLRGESTRSDIPHVMESERLLDALYLSAKEKREIDMDGGKKQ